MEPCLVVNHHDDPGKKERLAIDEGAFEDAKFRLRVISHNNEY